MPFIALGIGAGAGLLKSQLVDRPKEDRQRTLAAQTQRFSPWTGLRAGNIEEADPFGTALKYGATGAGLESNIESANSANKFSQAASNRLNQGGSLSTVNGVNPWGGRSSQSFGMDSSNPWERRIPGGW